MTMLLFVSALLVLAVPTLGENPAVRVTLTDKGLQYGKAAGEVRGQLEADLKPSPEDKTVNVLA